MFLSRRRASTLALALAAELTRRQVRKQLAAPILGSDLRRDAIHFAVTSARAAGVGHLVHFEQKDLHDFQPPEKPGTILCNPPYGIPIVKYIPNRRISNHQNWMRLEIMYQLSRGDHHRV